MNVQQITVWNWKCQWKLSFENDNKWLLQRFRKYWRIIFCYLLDCWVFSNKFQLILNSRNFPQMFSPDFLFCHSERFVEPPPPQNGYWLEQDLLNIVDMVELTCLNPFFFYVNPVECDLALSKAKHNFSPIDTCAALNRRFSCTSYDYWEYMSTLSVWLRFKISKWIISHYTRSISFLPWSSTFGESCRDSFLSIHCFLVEYCYKKSIFCLLLYSWETLYFSVMKAELSLRICDLSCSFQ